MVNCFHLRSRRLQLALVLFQFSAWYILRVQEGEWGLHLLSLVCSLPVHILCSGANMLKYYDLLWNFPRVCCSSGLSKGTACSACGWKARYCGGCDSAATWCPSWSCYSDWYGLNDFRVDFGLSGIFVLPCWVQVWSPVQSGCLGVVQMQRYLLFPAVWALVVPIF